MEYKNFTYRIQIDFIGPLTTFRNMYVCTMVDTCTGLGMVNSYNKSHTVLKWISAYGIPVITESDQGSNFTGNLVKQMVD